MNTHFLESHTTIFKDFFSHLEEKPLDITEDTINKMDEDFQYYHSTDFSPVDNENKKLVAAHFLVSTDYLKRKIIRNSKRRDDFYYVIKENTLNNCFKVFPHEWKYKKPFKEEKIDQGKFKEFLELNPEYAQIHKKYAGEARLFSTESFQEICNKTMNEVTNTPYKTNYTTKDGLLLDAKSFSEIEKMTDKSCLKIFKEMTGHSLVEEYNQKFNDNLKNEEFLDCNSIEKIIKILHKESLIDPNQWKIYDLFSCNFAKIIVKIAELEALTSFIQKQEKEKKIYYHYNIVIQAAQISWNQLNDLFLLINKSENEFLVLCDAKIVRYLDSIIIGIALDNDLIFSRDYGFIEKNQNPQKPVFPENVFFINDPLNKSLEVLKEIQFPFYSSKKNYNELRQRGVQVISKGYIASKLDRVWLHESRYPYPLGTPKSDLLHRVIINSLYGGGEMQVCCGGIHGITPETLFLVFSSKTLKLTAIAEVKELDSYHSRIRIKWGKLEENEDPYLYVHHQRKFSNITEENKNQHFLLNCVQKKWNDFINQVTNRAEKGKKELEEVILLQQKEDKELTLKEIFAQKNLRKFKYVPNMEIPVSLDDIIFFKCKPNLKEPAATMGEWPYCGGLPFIRNISHWVRKVRTGKREGLLLDEIEDEDTDEIDEEQIIKPDFFESFEGYDFFKITEMRNLEFSKLTIVFARSMKDIPNTGCGCSDDKQIVLKKFHASELDDDGLESTSELDDDGLESTSELDDDGLEPITDKATKTNHHRCAISTVHFVPENK